MGIATAFGEHPLLGVMAGSVTLVGGPATGLAFAPLFEQAGLVGAAPLALAAATVGIVCGGLAGGPVGTYLTRRFNLSSRSRSIAELQEELAPPAAQVAVVVLFALTVCFIIMGRDYDSAVMASGFVGFVLGTTANAVANMRALVVRFGPAPRAFLVVPIVGAFFIAFTNAVIITLFVNWLS